MEQSSKAQALTPFKAATDWAEGSDGIWRGVVTPDWTQGKAAFGGVIIGGAIRALDRLVGEDRRPRALSASLMSALTPGEITGHATVLRSGRSVSVAEMQVRQGDTLGMTILANFGVERKSAVHFAPDSMPERPAPDAVPIIPFIPKLMPPCLQHFETRFTDGQPPFTSSTSYDFGGYIRLREPGDHPEAAVMAMLDAMPFPFMQTMPAPAPVTSIMITAHFLDIVDVPLTEPWWLHSRTIHAEKGYATFETRLYRPDGSLGASAEQLVGVYDG